MQNIIDFLGDNHFILLTISREMDHKVILPQKINYVPNFLKQQDIGNFMSFWNMGSQFYS